jgi:hypothetical protein
MIALRSAGFSMNSKLRLNSFAFVTIADWRTMKLNVDLTKRACAAF